MALILWKKVEEIEKMDSQIPTTLNEVIDRHGLTPRQAKILEQRLLGVPNNLIAEIVGCGQSTLYRELGKPQLEQAMTELMTIALRDNTVTASQVVHSALDLVNETIKSETIPIQLRLEASKIIFDAYSKLSASQREQSVTEMFMKQNMPKPVSNSSFDLAR